MKRLLLVLMIGSFAIGSPNIAFAGDGEKGSGYEHGSEMPNDDVHTNLKITKQDMQDVMKKYIAENSADGVFQQKDAQSGAVRRLSFAGLHEDLKMKDGKHFSCADFEDLDSGEVLDVDVFIDFTDGNLQVADTAIHKVDGVAVNAGGEADPKGSDTEAKGSVKGSGSDH